MYGTGFVRNVENSPPNIRGYTDIFYSVGRSGSEGENKQVTERYSRAKATCYIWRLSSRRL